MTTVFKTAIGRRAFLHLVQCALTDLISFVEVAETDNTVLRDDMQNTNPTLYHAICNKPGNSRIETKFWNTFEAPKQLLRQYREFARIVEGNAELGRAVGELLAREGHGILRGDLLSDHTVVAVFRQFDDMQLSPAGKFQLHLLLWYLSSDLTQAEARLDDITSNYPDAFGIEPDAAVANQNPPPMADHDDRYEEEEGVNANEDEEEEEEEEEEEPSRSVGASASSLDNEEEERGSDDDDLANDDGAQPHDVGGESELAVNDDLGVGGEEEEECFSNDDNECFVAHLGLSAGDEVVLENNVAGALQVPAADLLGLSELPDGVQEPNHVPDFEDIILVPEQVPVFSAVFSEDNLLGEYV